MTQSQYQVFETLVLASDYPNRFECRDRRLLLTGQGLYLLPQLAYFILILHDLHISSRIAIEVSYEYTYPVVDQALRNFLVFVLMLLTVITVAVGIGIAFGVIEVSSVAAFFDAPLAVASVVFSWYQ